MDATEFKYRFSVLFNNIMSNAAPGLTDYEISLYLTKAQLELCKDYLNPKGNKYGEGFDGSMKRQADFSALIKTDTLNEINTEHIRFDNRSILYEFPEKYIAIIGENLALTKDNYSTVRQVVPISYLEYTRLMLKPYKEPLKNQAWRLITDSDNVAELILTTQDLTFSRSYAVRYVRMPKPIIVSNLHSIHETLFIDGEYEQMTSELNEELHDEILQRAVEIAKASYATDQSGQAQLQNQITVGQRSE